MIHKVVVRNPDRRYIIAVAESDWLAALGYLACDPQIEGPEPELRHLAVVGAGPFVQLQEPDAEPKIFASIFEVRNHLHGRFFTESVAGAYPVLHAASLRYQDRRVLLAAPKSAGKSTLSLGLGLAGFAIEGDENIFVTPAGVIARPRACRVKESSAEILPELGPLIAAAPYAADYHGRKIYNLSPEAFGQNWRIAPGKADIIISLHANHGGMSSIRRAPPMLMTQTLIAEAGFAPGAKAAAIAGIIGLVRGAGLYELSVGHLAEAIGCVKSVLAV